jgi:beta-lysine 5,6-aminomutase alpha subunit
MKLVERARGHAKNIAGDVQKYIDVHSTVAIERSIVRLLGVDGVNEVGVPLPNIIVDHIAQSGLLPTGVAMLVGNAMVKLNLTPLEIAEKINAESLDVCKLAIGDISEVKDCVYKEAKKSMEKIDGVKRKREELLDKLGEKQGPLIYVMVATGNIHEDIAQATAAAKQGADIVSVIRSTGQSLLDYVPYGINNEGFGGTFATQANIRLMREALDKVSHEVGRYIRQCNYASGLCMPEICVFGALERLDYMMNDAFYGIIFRDVNMKRTFVDQYFSRVINNYSGIVINTGEDNFLTTADAYEAAHTVLASHLLNEQFAKKSGLPDKQIGLGATFQINPALENSFLFELAQCALEREVFPDGMRKYQPPTKFMTGDIFQGNVQNALYNIITMMTDEKVHLLGMLTEAIHTPFLSDRSVSIENAKYVFRAMKDVGDEFIYKEGGIIQRRAQEVMQKAADLLFKIERDTLFKSLGEGVFANVKRHEDGGKGLSGVFEKDEEYINPFMELMRKGGEN